MLGKDHRIDAQGPTYQVHRVKTTNEKSKKAPCEVGGGEAERRAPALLARAGPRPGPVQRPGHSPGTAAPLPHPSKGCLNQAAAAAAFRWQKPGPQGSHCAELCQAGNHGHCLHVQGSCRTRGAGKAAARGRLPLPCLPCPDLSPRVSPLSCGAARVELVLT